MPIHVRAQKEEIAPYVLVPGDPNRSTYIAENYLEGAKCYTSYRQMFGYTGTYKGVPVSVQTTGMGAASTLIVMEEMIRHGAEAFTRVGTCGGLQTNIQMADILINTTAWSTRHLVEELVGSDRYVPSATPEMVIIAERSARENYPEIKTHLGPVSSEEMFYCDVERIFPKLRELGCLGVEMEAAYIYACCAKYQKKASCLTTVSDLLHCESFERATDEKIQEGTDKMVRIALDTFVEMHQSK